MEKEFNLSEERETTKQILSNVYNDEVERRIIELCFANVENEDKEFIKRLKEEISNINKKLDLHNVDECECCEKNWKCVYEILEIIDEFAGDKLKEIENENEK